MWLHRPIVEPFSGGHATRLKQVQKLLHLAGTTRSSWPKGSEDFSSPSRPTDLLWHFRQGANKLFPRNTLSFKTSLLQRFASATLALIEPSKHRSLSKAVIHGGQITILLRMTLMFGIDAVMLLAEVNRVLIP